VTPRTEHTASWIDSTLGEASAPAALQGADRVSGECSSAWRARAGVTGVLSIEEKAVTRVIAP